MLIYALLKYKDQEMNMHAATDTSIDGKGVDLENVRLHGDELIETPTGETEPIYTSYIDDASER